MELESLAYFGSCFTFQSLNKLYFLYKFPQIIVFKLISKNFTCFSVNIVEIIAILNMKSRNEVYFARESREMQLYLAAFLCFWKSQGVGWRD